MHQLRVNHHLHHHPVGSKKVKKIRNVLLLIIFKAEQHSTPTLNKSKLGALVPKIPVDIKIITK